MPLGAFKAALMGTAGASAGADVVLLATATADGDTSLAFTSGIDSTYGEYIFRWYNCNPATDGAHFSFQANAAGGSGYDEAMVTTQFFASHYDDDSSQLLYHDGFDQQLSDAAFQGLAISVGNGGDEACSGELHLFNPSSTTYVKHFYSNVQTYVNADRSVNYMNAGYINTTSAIDEIQFKMSSGNFDGTIKMWGVK